MFLDHSEITLEMNKRKVTRGKNAIVLESR